MSKGSYAELTAGLLARKGEAVPATASFNGENIISTQQMRRHLSMLPRGKENWHEISDDDVDPRNSAAHIPVDAAPDDQTASAPPQASHAPKAAVNNDTDAPCDPCVPLAALAGGDDHIVRRQAVTFRLDTIRYICLKMATAKLHRTNQDIMIAALDMYLKSLSENALGDCACLQKLINGES